RTAARSGGSWRHAGERWSRSSASSPEPCGPDSAGGVLAPVLLHPDEAVPGRRRGDVRRRLGRKLHQSLVLLDRHALASADHLVEPRPLDALGGVLADDAGEELAGTA